MTLLQIVGFYTALNFLLLPILLVRVGQMRMQAKVSLGDGENKDLRARIRTHGNYTENAPFVLIGLLLLALLQAPALLLHILGISFILARLLHAHGMAQPKAVGKGRILGASLNSLVLIGLSISLLYMVFLT